MPFRAGWSGGRGKSFIFGTFSIGSVLTAVGPVDNWQRDDLFGQSGEGTFADIPLATAQTYVVTAADIGYAIRVRGPGPVFTNSLRFQYPAPLVEAWDPHTPAVGVIPSWVGDRGTVVSPIFGSATKAAASMNGGPGITMAGVLSGALDLSAYNTLRVGVSMVDADATLQLWQVSLGADLVTIPGSIAIVGNNGVADRQAFYAAGGTGFGGRRLDPEDVSVPTLLTAVFNISGTNVSAVDSLWKDGVLQADVVSANTATAGVFANANINFGGKEDGTALWPGTFGMIWIMSGNAIDADFADMNAYAMNCNGI